MSEQVENHTIRLLQELRAELAEFRSDTAAQFDSVSRAIGSLAQTTVAVKSDVATLKLEVTAMRGDINTIALAVDHHSERLERIEHHLGLDRSPH